MRLGLFGGTFDPPHVGHLLVASDAVETLALDRLIFIPAATQPFKQGAVAASPRQRLEMLRLTIGGDPRFAVDPIEIDRAGLSYTVDTLAAYAAREPQAQRYLLVGEDLLEELPNWHEARRMAGLAEIVVLARGRRADDVIREGPASSAIPFIRIATRRVDVSSTEIRDRVRAGRPIGGFVTAPVAGFIRTATLYR